jgi:dTDP-4-amino-4,6-dideoxygalactose transaminase
MNNKINVTKVFLPPLEEYTNQVKRAFDNAWLTNRGELVLELEMKLKSYLGIEHLLIMNNGTIPLQILMHLLGEKGEVITTPFSYVATTAAIVWEGCVPVFVDIEPDTFCIDPKLIEAAITPRTKGILATHVFGNPCDIEAIEEIANRYGLWVVYDAAHAFGVKYKGKSIFSYGTASTCSFHATKLFHTGEGGAVFTNDNNLQHRLFYSHNFGHNGPLTFHGLGVNGKISELQAAMGLAVLPHLEYIYSRRKVVIEEYLKELSFLELKFQKLRESTEWNYSYFPIVFESEAQLLSVEKELLKDGISARRYFFPSLNSLPYVDFVNCRISQKIASTILCLPLSTDIDLGDVKRICSIISRNSH